MVGYIIPVGPSREENWRIGRNNGIWAPTTNFDIKENDELFFWLSKKGLASHAVATSSSTKVTNSKGFQGSIIRNEITNGSSRSSSNSIELIDEPISVVESCWNAIQNLLGTKDAPNKPAIRIDANQLDLFIELFTESSRSGPPVESLAAPDVDASELARDERDYAFRSIAQRHGQASFRKSLLSIYRGKVRRTRMRQGICLGGRTHPSGQRAPHELPKQWFVPTKRCPHAVRFVPVDHRLSGRRPCFANCRVVRILPAGSYIDQPLACGQQLNDIALGQCTPSPQQSMLLVTTIGRIGRKRIEKASAMKGWQ